MLYNIPTKALDNKKNGTMRASDLAQVLKSFPPKHPALNRLHGKLISLAGVKAITGYDRMHHRHNRS
jgi:hypothetical protein